MQDVRFSAVPCVRSASLGACAKMPGGGAQFWSPPACLATIYHKKNTLLTDPQGNGVFVLATCGCSTRETPYVAAYTRTFLVVAPSLGQHRIAVEKPKLAFGRVVGPQCVGHVQNHSSSSCIDYLRHESRPSLRLLIILVVCCGFVAGRVPRGSTLARGLARTIQNYTQHCRLSLVSHGHGDTWQVGPKAGLRSWAGVALRRRRYVVAPYVRSPAAAVVYICLFILYHDAGQSAARRKKRKAGAATI